MKLENKSILVTGGSRGIGRAIAIGMAKEGADIGISYVNKKEKALEVAQEIKNMGSKAVVIQADVSKVSECYGLIDEFFKKFSKMDVLVNNAGICILGKFTNSTEQDYDRVMNTNLKGEFFCAQAAAKKMIKQGGGTIINMSSLNGIVGEPDQCAYNASKGGINMITKSLALELAGYNIKVNGLGPGFIVTEAAEEDVADAEVRREYLQNIPLHRFGKPEDVVGAAVFLASSDSDYFVGQTLYMDGGIMIQQFREMRDKR
ncbi:3-oxoacyl-ACP reductase FabG [bacterium]|nr:3-oxoacyl-ACP reductase FabG [bacterium]